MILLNIDEIQNIHRKLIIKTGGLDGVRDIGLLESAIYSANVVFADKEQYPTIEQKAARLAFGLVKNHAFLDGNKRIGILTMLITLNLNHITIIYTQSELIQLGLSIADGSFTYDDILKWIMSHKK